MKKAVIEIDSSQLLDGRNHIKRKLGRRKLAIPFMDASGHHYVARFF